jgi:hypothetical protein
MKTASRKVLVGTLCVTTLGLWGYDVFLHVRQEVWEAKWEAQQEIKRHTQIEGQVFTVGKDGQSIRLGDVRVCLYWKGEFDKNMAEAVSASKEQLAQADKIVETCIAGGMKFLDYMTEDITDADRRSALDALRLSNQTEAEAKERRNELIEQIVREASAQLHPITMVTTDADGRFHMEVDKSLMAIDFYLYADAHRRRVETGAPLIWVIDSWQVSSPLILSDSNGLTEYRLTSFHQTTVMATPHALRTSEAFWWLAHAAVLGLLVGAGGLGLSWAWRGRPVEEPSPPEIRPAGPPPLPKHRRPIYQLPTALIIGLGLLAMSYCRMDTHNFSHEQHPIAFILETATPAFLGALLAYWLLGRCRKNTN